MLERMAQRIESFYRPERSAYYDSLLKAADKLSPSLRAEVLKALVEQLGKLPDDRMVETVDKLIERIPELGASDGSSVLELIAAQCGKQRKTARAILERVRDCAESLPDPHRTQPLARVAERLHDVPSNAQFALFDSLAKIAETIAPEHSAPLVFALAASNHQGMSDKQQGIAFGKALALAARLPEEARSRPLAKLARSSHFLAVPECWQAFRTIVSMPANDGRAVASAAQCMFDRLPPDTLIDAFDLAFQASLLYPHEFVSIARALTPYISRLPEDARQDAFDRLDGRLVQLSAADASCVAAGLVAVIHHFPMETWEATVTHLGNHLTAVADGYDRFTIRRQLHDLFMGLPYPQRGTVHRVILRIPLD